jgi:hypothetical protein
VAIEPAGNPSPGTRGTVFVVVALAALVVALLIIFGPSVLETTGHYSKTV